MSVGEVHAVVLPLSIISAPTADDTVLVMKAPRDAIGGGITIVGADAVNAATTSGTVGFALSLLKYSTAGTPALNGTVAAAIGGTAAASFTDAATHWTADVPKAFTLGADLFMDAGEWLALVYDTTNAGTPTSGAITLYYQMGR